MDTSPHTGVFMARSRLPNYRKLAFEKYAPICVHCGFGIKEVLEVAHLDCNPKNCELDNLAILCPTCHRMHDIDLIPTDAIIRLRDEKRKPRWAKLTKDAARKAVETKRLDPELMKRAAQKAVATRKARKAASNGA
jgi:5-methylcytosine-specific restriction endonuclease McrA